MSFHDNQYLALVQDVLSHGAIKSNRTDVNTIGVFGRQMRFDLRDGTIPLLTTKKMHTRSIIHEILWYLQGADNTKYLTENNVTIWDEWADESGYLGPIYGFQWRNWRKYTITDADEDGNWLYTMSHIDQIANLINTLKTNPNDRRLIVSAWNVADLADMHLPPCHYVFQCYARPLSPTERVMIASRTHHIEDLLTSNINVERFLDEQNIPKYELSLMLNQRSCDVGLGVPFNIVQYSILLRMIAEVTNMAPGDFIWNGGDIHVYENHIDQLKEQCERAPYLSPSFSFASPVNSIDDFSYEDFVIIGYEHHPLIKMDVAV